MSDLHALLVGIDRYRPERFPDGRPIRALLGAVNDVARIRRFLENGPFGVPADRIRELVSPHPWAHRSTPADAALPTRESLVREIRALPERAAPGDRVLIHYSGHGARLPTAVPEVKGPSARDECLAPCDAGAAVVRNASDRTLELAVLDLRPDRAIHRLYPFPGDGDTTTLDPGADIPVFARAELPDGRDEGHDRLKVVVGGGSFTTGPMARPGPGGARPAAALARRRALGSTRPRPDDRPGGRGLTRYPPTPTSTRSTFR